MHQRRVRHGSQETPTWYVCLFVYNPNPLVSFFARYILMIIELQRGCLCTFVLRKDLFCCFYFLDSLRFSADKSHLHNEFFLAILNKCQALASFQPSPSTRIPPVALGSPSPPATTSLGQPRFSQLGPAHSIGGDDRLKVGSLKVLEKNHKITKRSSKK